MVARSGLGVVPVPGSPPVGMSAADHRLILGAQFGPLAQCLAGGAFTPSSSTMQYTSPYSVWAIPDNANSGAVYHSGVDAATLTLSAGPASGSRIDSIYVVQNDYEKGAADSRVTLGVQAGTAGTGTPPTLTAAGAVRLANILVPANVTKATDCTITYIVPPNALAEGNVRAANKALLDAQPGLFPGQLGFVDSGAIAGVVCPVTCRWDGSAWQAWDSNWVNTSALSTSNVTYSLAAQARYRSGKIVIRFYGACTANGGGGGAVQIGGLPPRDAPSGLAPLATGSFYVSEFSDVYPLTADWSGTTTLILYMTATSGKRTPITTSSPVTFDANSNLWGEFEYDPA